MSTLFDAPNRHRNRKGEIMKPNFLLLVAFLLAGCSSLYMEPGELLRSQNAANINKL